MRRMAARIEMLTVGLSRDEHQLEVAAAPRNAGGVPYTVVTRMYLTLGSAALITTFIDLNGTWAIGSVPGPVISVSGNSLSVDMSASKRPTATGSILIVLISP